MTVIEAFLATLGVCLLSAVVPFVNAELYLLAAASVASSRLAPALVVAAALGQMLGKSLMYYAGRGALRLPSERLRRMVATVERRYREEGAAGAAVGSTVILASAGLGLPPFYVVSIACGILRIPFAQFFVLGLLGRLARFGVIVLGPQLARAWGQS
ncbi:MAG TPA: VTT domain-containing protein [Gemmatimonadaceae bacterium]|nr:VTT domain-containing protein [Gemmatimonadaceae bacterium]